MQVVDQDPALAELVRRMRETLTQPRYDQITLVNSAAQVQHSFFTNTAAKNRLQTNMEVPSMLPSPRQLLVQHLSVIPSFDAALADMQNILTQGACRFRISDKDYNQIPIFGVPGGVGVSGFAATNVAEATTFISVSNGVPSPMARFEMAPPGQLIRRQENFAVILDFPAGLTLSANVNTWVFLWGLELRAVQ